MEVLPHELALNILSKLPITSVLTVRSVCHSWKNLVNDPLLVRMHFSQMSQKNPSLILHCNFPVRSQFYFLENSGRSEDGETVKRIILPEMPDFISAVSCNGLICWYDLQQTNSVYVFNPFTRNLLELPKPEQLSERERLSFGFGFVPATNEYKVVRIVYFRSEERHPAGRFHMLRANVQIFSLAGSSWRSIGETSHQLQRKPSQTMVHGRLHWLTLRRVQQPLRMIVSFDLADENFRIVPEPNFILFRQRHSHLAVLGGCLSLAAYTRSLQFEIWIMKDYDVKESWIKAFTIGDYLPKELNQSAEQSFIISEMPNNVRVLCMLENGEILIDFRGRALLVYEPRSSNFKQLRFPGLPNYFEPIVHIGCLNWVE